MMPAIDNIPYIAVYFSEKFAPEIRIDVGPSAPPIMPMELAPLMSEFNLCDKYVGKRKLKAKLTTKTVTHKTVKTITIFLILMLFIYNSSHFCLLIFPLIIEYFIYQLAVLLISRILAQRLQRFCHPFIIPAMLIFITLIKELPELISNGNVIPVD